MEKPTVISLGGSMIAPSASPHIGGIDTVFLKNFRDVILKFVEQGKTFFIITGGGSTCRNYQNAAREVAKITDENLDWLGIYATQLNGHLVRSIFKDSACPQLITNYKEKEEIEKPIAVAAGWLPGHSTDFDAVLAAKMYNANTIINLSDIKYVYDKDPKKFPDAKPQKALSWKAFLEIIGEEWVPGRKTPFDPVASKEAEKLGLKVVVISGHDLRNFENYLEDKGFEGTIIS